MKHLLVFVLFFLTLAGHAQNQPNTADEKLPIHLKLMARNKGKEVVLRWAFSESEAWRYLNGQGYVLERFELDHATNKLKQEAPVRIGGGSIRPWTEAEFQARVTPRDSLLAIAGQCLYGEDQLTVEAAGGNLFRQLELKAQSDDNRMLFAMMAASFSPLAAQSLGMGWVDKDVRPGLKYIYRLRVEDDLQTRFQTDTSLYVVVTDEVLPIEIPAAPLLETGDSVAILEWVRSPLFVAYHVERSKDGQKWQRLTQRSFLNLNGTAASDGKRITYSDALPANYVEYQYRVRGITIFGEETPPSDVVSGSGRDLTPTAPPVLTSAKNTEGDRVELKWNMPNVPDLGSFVVKRGISMEGPWEALTEKPLPASARAFTDPNAEAFGLNFYRVFSIDDHGNENGCYPTYVKMKNQAPPATPVGLTGTIDTAGTLTLHWAANKELDLLGYEVFYANQSDHAYVVMSDSILRDTFLTTRISVRNLTGKIYFKVRALDYHYSLSHFSAPLELKKPDLVAPSRPVFSDFYAGENGIQLKWASSSSKDVVQYRLERSEDKTGWETIATLPSNAQSYTDSLVKSGVRYKYSIVAIDDAGLASGNRSMLEVQARKVRYRPAIEGLEARILPENGGVQLNWTYKEAPEKVQFKVFQVLEDGSLRQLGEVTGKDKFFVDKTVARAGKTVRYGVRAVHREGGASPLATTGMVQVK